MGIHLTSPKSTNLSGLGRQWEWLGIQCKANKNTTFYYLYLKMSRRLRKFLLVASVCSSIVSFEFACTVNPGRRADTHYIIETVEGIHIRKQ